MAWIEAHDNLPDHIKTVESAAALKMDKDALVGKLLRLWTWALDNRQTGFISYADMETVSERMRWGKKPETLFAALCHTPDGHTHGFLYEVDGGYMIHDWDIYTKQYCSSEVTRKKDRERKRKASGNPQEIRRNSDGIPSEKTRNSACYHNLHHNQDHILRDDDNAHAREDDRELPLDLSPADIADYTDNLRAVREVCRHVGMPFDSQQDDDDAAALWSEYSLDWLLKAIRIAGRMKSLNWRYIQGILRKSKKRGYIDDGPPNPSNGAAQGGETAGSHGAHEELPGVVNV